MENLGLLWLKWRKRNFDETKIPIAHKLAVASTRIRNASVTVRRVCSRLLTRRKIITYNMNKQGITYTGRSTNGKHDHVTCFFVYGVAV